LNEQTEKNTGNGWSLIRDQGPRRRTGRVFRGTGGHALAGLPGCVQPIPALLAGFTNAGHPYECGCLALGTRIGARVAFQGRMVVDPRLGTNHAAEVGAGPDRPVMRACRSGSERSDWKKRNQSRRAIGIIPDHSSRTCSDLALPSVRIIAETGFTYTGLVSSFAGSGHTVLDSPTAQSLTPGDFLDARASADLVEPDQLASMNRRGNLGPGSRTLHVSCLALVCACELAPLCDRSDCPCHLGRSSAALPRSNPILRMRYVLLFRSCNITELNRNRGASPSLIRL